MSSTHLKLFCLTDGEATSKAFSVKIHPSDTVDDLKNAIKVALAPQVDNIAAKDLTLWRVSHPVIAADKHSPILLSTIDSKTELDPTDDIADVFAEEPRKKAIHIIVQRPPPDRVSGAAFVQHILKEVTGINQRLGTSTDTRRRYSLTPTSVGNWDAFLPMVRQLSLETEPKYPRPSFSPRRIFVTESNLHEIFSIDVGSVESLPPFANTLSSLGLPHGKPDLVCSRNDGQSLLFPIEMKRPVELQLDADTSYLTAYLAQGSLSQSPAGPLKQIFGYMRFNRFRYGVLSTYTQTWFIKRVSAHDNDILVSPTIRFDRANPTLLQCYLWLIRTADNDSEGQLDIPDETAVEAMLSKEQSEDKAAKRDSDYNPGRGKKMKQGVRNLLTRSSSKRQTRAMQQERLKFPAFKNMELIAQGEGARTFRATWMNEDVVVKKADVWNQHSVADELEHEAKVYEALQTLQGRYVPRLKIAGVADGMEMILVTEFTGTDLCDERLDASDRNKIREALSVIHDLGILHGDIRPENITAKRDGQNSRFFFIDFGLSEFTRRKEALEREADKLELLLNWMPWPEGQAEVLAGDEQGTSQEGQSLARHCQG